MGFANAVWDFMWLTIVAVIGYWAATTSDSWYTPVFYVFCLLVLGAVVAYKAYKGYYK